ncbi:MAG TPA: hypothetical protein VFG30_41900 [Polyangiales bacterium]|nr:hypothetical protein [Polyangiales bacterium]
MPTDPLSRYRALTAFVVQHAARGVTLALPIRREMLNTPSAADRVRRFASYDTADLLALKGYGREDLYWIILDANGGRLPETWEVGETLRIPPADRTTRIDRR